MYLPHGGAWPLTRPPAVPAGEAGPAPGERRTPMKMIMNISTTTTTTTTAAAAATTTTTTPAATTTSTYTNIHTGAGHAYIRTCVRTYIHTCIHAHTHTHTYIHTYIHTRTYALHTSTYFIINDSKPTICYMCY